MDTSLRFFPLPFCVEGWCSLAPGTGGFGISSLEDCEQVAHHLAGPEGLEEQWQGPEKLDRQVVVYLVEKARSAGYYLCLKHPLDVKYQRASDEAIFQGDWAENRLNGICVVV
jgi:hypothetical protein